MPQVQVEPDGVDLVVRFAGWDALWTLRREARVRIADVTDVGTTPVDAVHRRGRVSSLRGTMFPGIIQAGSFTDARGRQLWDVRASGEAVVIELGGEAPYRRWVLQVADVEQNVGRLRKLLPT